VHFAARIETDLFLADRRPKAVTSLPTAFSAARLPADASAAVPIRMGPKPGVQNAGA
jgi:hypothetical protein